MNRTKAFVQNSFTTALLQIITMIVGFITPRVMLSHYGSEINGLVSSITQFISYFNLVEAGLSGAAVYALYAPLAKKDHKEINAVISAAKSFYTQAGFIFVSLTLGLALIYPFYIKSADLSFLSVGLLVLILGINGALEFFTLSKYRALLTADQKTYVISLATIIQIVINTIIIVVLAEYKVNIVLLRFIALFSIFLRSAILMVYCKKNYKYLNYKEKPNKKALNKRWDALYLQILGTVQAGAPVVILTIMVKELTLVSIYSIYNMVITGISGVVGIFTSGLSASFGDVIARKETETLKKTYKEFEFIYYAIITVVYAITFVTIMPFIKIYTADINDADYNLPIVGFLFVLNGLLYNIKTPQGMLVISAGMYKETRVQSTVQALIIIVLGMALAPFWGINGVLIGAIASNIYRCIDLIHFIPKQLTKTSVFNTYGRVIRIFSCITVIWLPFLVFDFKPATLVTWVLYAMIVGIFALLVTITVNMVFDKKETVNIIKRLKYLVGNK